MKWAFYDPEFCNALLIFHFSTIYFAVLLSSKGCSKSSTLPTLWMIFLESSLKVLNVSVSCRSVISAFSLDCFMRVCANLRILFVLSSSSSTASCGTPWTPGFDLELLLIRDRFTDARTTLELHIALDLPGFFQYNCGRQSWNWFTSVSWHRVVKDSGMRSGLP